MTFSTLLWLSEDNLEFVITPRLQNYLALICVINKIDENDVAIFFACHGSSNSDTESSAYDSFTAWGM